ncbi:MAG: hypothetical protein A2X59_10585 [Nitrospirae bacterium GWC2_42_7]|nr:MAG: hypothetical protein A2X59_10585 [Nitrospirae bacterium GWC2_42_7]
MKNTLVFVVFVLVVVGLLFSISGKRSPQIPNDTDHRAITDTTVCLGCHGPSQKYQRKTTHPPKHECFKCHKNKKIRRENRPS